jgi:hypothetical protein
LQSIQLSAEQRNHIRDQIDAYRTFLKSDEAKQILYDEKKRMERYVTLLSKNNVSSISEAELGEVLSSLWAMAFWTNKDWAVNNTTQKNDIHMIRKELGNLLYGDEPLSSRYDRFRSYVYGIGPSAITEILAFIHPTKYGMWNDKVRKAAPLLGLDKLLPNKYSINGKEYEKYNEVFSLIKD